MISILCSEGSVLLFGFLSLSLDLDPNKKETRTVVAAIITVATKILIASMFEFLLEEEFRLGEFLSIEEDDRHGGFIFLHLPQVFM